MTTKEFEFLNIISSTLDDSSYIGDDCAYLKEYNLVISSDTLIEDVHFSSRYMNAYEIAKKAVLSNISDVLASGAKPNYITLNLSGKLNSDFVKTFFNGVNETINEFDVKLIGGDLTASDKIVISITAFGDAKKRNISSRAYAKPDYILAVCGEFGSSAQGLYNLQNNIKEDYFSNIHKIPKLNKEASEEVAKISKHPYAMMDSSDGLTDCLYQIATKSNVDIKIKYDKIPKETSNRDYVLFGGEDYSLVLAVEENDFKNLKHFIPIGKCYKTNNPSVFIDNIKEEYKGYNHFE